MIHLGDITKINGYTVPIVDVVVGGSPCQDLSVAGKRAGLDGERSGLFMEQLRIIKEMREHDRRNGTTGDVRPRYMVWENVPGAFSSNKAEDFRIVLEETAKACDKDASIPMPDNGRWTTSGCILGNGWSIAWRVCDAQFYGVPQRRRRIALIADFGGHSAPEILFVRKSVSRDTKQSLSERKETTSDAARSVRADDSIGVDIYNTKLTGDKACSLTAEGYTSTGTSPKVITPVYSVDQGGGKSACNVTEGQAQTLTCTHGGEPAVCYSVRIVRRLTPLECERLQGYPSELKLDVSKMTKDEYIAYNILEGNIIVDTEAGKVYRTRGPGGVKLDKPQEMKGSDSNGYLVVKISNGTTKMMCRIHRIIWISKYGVIPDGYCIDHINSNKKDNRISNLQLLTPQENSTKAAEDGLYLTGEDNHATKISPDLYDEIAYLHHCEGKTMRQLAEIYGISKSRIQQIVKEVGWTDIGEWTDSKGKVHKTSDAARYKALGNSIALPPWKWVIKRLSACYERDATLASLFDGLGGFPYLWEQLNGKGSCLWASEIEEFPIAVTKKRIGE